MELNERVSNRACNEGCIKRPKMRMRYLNNRIFRDFYRSFFKTKGFLLKVYGILKERVIHSSTCNNTHTYIFYKKLRIWASTESFLKLSDFEYLRFLMSFLKVL